MQHVLFLFALTFVGFNPLFAQEKWYVTVTMAPSMTDEVYDGIFEKIRSAGLTNCFSEYHAAGPSPEGGYFGFTTFSSKAQCDARLATLKPFIGGVNPTPYETVFVFGNPTLTEITDKTIIVYFEPKGMTESQYGQITANLEKSAALVNPNQMYHVAFKTPEGVKVIDVWKDAESFAEAGKVLLPIIASVGVTLPKPLIIPAHAIRIPSQSDKNIDATLSAYSYFNMGDIASILAMVTDDCDWSHAGNTSIIPFAGNFKGKAGVGRFFENVGKFLAITKFEPVNFSADGNAVTCKINIEGSVLKTGKIYASTLEQTFWFDSNGMISKWAATGDVSSLEAAFTN